MTFTRFLLLALFGSLQMNSPRKPGAVRSRSRSLALGLVMCLSALAGPHRAMAQVVHPGPINPRPQLLTYYSARFSQQELERRRAESIVVGFLARAPASRDLLLSSLSHLRPVAVDRRFP
jgi:hypothetical protein